MKHKIFAFLALLLTLAAACAGAQQRPSVGCFSPGLVRVSEKMKENPTVSADVTLTVENAFYARNLSVLKKMLEGTTLRVWGDDARGGLTLERGGETLMQADVAQDGRISVDGHPLETGISVPDEAQTDWNALAEQAANHADFGARAADRRGSVAEGIEAGRRSSASARRRPMRST